MTKRFFALVLCMILCLGLIPAAAFAEEGAIIKNVSMTVFAPEVGETPNNTIYFSNHACTVDRVIWTNTRTEETLSATDTFGGDKYQVFIVLKAAGDNLFYMDTDSTSPTWGEYPVEVKINGNKVPAGNVSGGGEQKYLYVSYVFPAPEYKELYEADVSITAPEAFETASHDVSLNGEGYMHAYSGYEKNKNLIWYDEDGKEATKFAPGGTYTAEIRINTKSGYVWGGDSSAPSITAKVNGKNADSVKWLNNLGLRDYIAIRYTFPTLPGGPIQKVEITKPPVKTEYLEGEAFDPTGMEVSAVYKDGTKSVMSSDAYYISNSDVNALEPDTIYIYVYAKDTKIHGSQPIKVTAVPKTTIKNIAISVTAPKVGEKPAYSAAVSTEGCRVDTAYNENQYVKGILWAESEGTGQELYQNAVPIDADSSFEAGKIYMVGFRLAANSGYQFMPSKGLPELTATVNGVKTEFLIGSKDSFVVVFAFDPLEAEPQQTPKTLESIAVTKAPNKTEYIAGESFDTAGMVVTASYSDKSSAPVSNYSVYPDGKLAEGDTSVTVSYTEGKVTKTAEQAISVKAPKTPKTLKITTAPDKTEYAVGESFSKKGMVVTVSYTDGSTAVVQDYSVSPSKMAADTTSVTVSYSENDKTVTAEQKVTVSGDKLVNPFVDMKEGDYFYDAVLWAYYMQPQVAAGVDSTHFGPTSTVTRGQAMAFLWRAMGRPEPKTSKNPFVDVKETEYYYKAILWAGEQGVTYGTDATHFSPGQTLSTAHIVTFLYRALGNKGGWYQVAADWAKSNGLLDAHSIKIDPSVDCPRADVVEFIYRKLAQ